MNNIAIGYHVSLNRGNSELVIAYNEYLWRKMARMFITSIEGESYVFISGDLLVCLFVC